MSERHSRRRLYQSVASALMSFRPILPRRRSVAPSLWLRCAFEICLPVGESFALSAQGTGKTETGDGSREVKVAELVAAVIGLIEPSDGHPQEEHSPDFGWFRPLSHNNATWVRVWPELEV